VSGAGSSFSTRIEALKSAYEQILELFVAQEVKTP
jgi:hypothetical protein